MALRFAHRRIKATSEKIVLCNVHLYWNPRSEDVKLLQSKLVSARCAQFAKKCTVGGGNSCPVLVCGDFNSLPKDSDGGVYDFWTTGKGSAMKVKKRVWNYYGVAEEEGDGRDGMEEGIGEGGREGGETREKSEPT